MIRRVAVAMGEIMAVGVAIPAARATKRTAKHCSMAAVRVPGERTM